MAKKTLELGDEVTIPVNHGLKQAAVQKAGVVSYVVVNLLDERIAELEEQTRKLKEDRDKKDK